ncbi:DoxX family protein [Jiangella mangrovi]|uniref:Putative membrane protein YphA (DoxX/SURF4 family) n=1 Tax=Jiangella mangrovi TaxID=1524084 RepID=A0A7W9GLS4_9ACTN|nr:putative membrane protein YphA (DoxX/SURF4 family) [Jiangella mangrovi]
MVDVAVWIAQIFLALFFLAAGLPKVAGGGIERWVGFDDVARPLVVLIGVAEVVAAVTLVAPMAVGAGEWTTPLAALGIAVISLMASGFHVRAAEGLPALETALWSALAGAVAVGRWDQLSGGPSLGGGVLVAALAVLVPAIVVNLVVLFRRPLPAAHSDDLSRAR